MVKKKGVLSVVNHKKVESSLLLRKTVRGGDQHAGGIFWDQSSPDYLALKQWISEGAAKQ
jgi:hypothetical protein